MHDSQGIGIAENKTNFLQQERYLLFRKLPDRYILFNVEKTTLKMNLNSQVTDFIQTAPAAQKQIMEAIRQLLHESVPDVREDYKWSRPVFRAAKDFVYLKTAKNYVTLGFFNFGKLEDSNNRLEGTGKEMRHIKLKTMADIDSELFKNWFQIAAE